MSIVRRELDLSVLDLSEKNASLQEQVRALDENERLKILGRPQIMTLENQPAFIQVGSRVPRITGTTVQSRGQANQIQLENVGLILAVTPRVSAEDTVVMEIDLEMSDVRENDDVVLSSMKDGPEIHASEIVTTTAQSTVTVASGKTILLGGMTKKSEGHRIEMVMLLSATIMD